MINVGDIFFKSPFQSLYKHLRNVIRCTEHLPLLVEAAIAGDSEEVERRSKKISNREQQADEIKDGIRAHLPRSIFMPISREDLLKYLHEQDNIADYCEEAALLISMRKFDLPEEIQPTFKTYVAGVMDTSTSAIEVIKQLKTLIRSSFTEHQSNEVLEALEKISPKEEAAEKLKLVLFKELFKLEEKLNPVTIMMTIKIADALGGIASSAERTANLLRLMIAKR